METLYQTSSKFLTREIGGEIIAVPVGIQDDRMNGFITFSETAGFLWKALKEPRSAEELTALICSEYDAEPGEVKSDIDDFLESCLKSGMITEV